MTERDESTRDREIQDLRRETSLLRSRLVLLSRLSQRIASSLELPRVFQHVVDSACELTNARYGALGVFGSSGKIERFVTHGLSQEERERIGDLPSGLGILGRLQGVSEPIRVDDLTRHPRSSVLPPNHPPMRTFLGVPIRHGDESMGNLYLTEKAKGAEFTPEDENLLVLFAAQAAMAIRNAELYRQVQDLAVLEERDRIGMDLHDGVIQALYATGLKLEGCMEDLDVEPDAVAPELQAAIEQLNRVIADVRSYVMNLLPGVLAETDLAGAVGGLLQELKANDLLDVELIERPGACRSLTEEQTRSLFLVAQEALTNVRRHASASHVSAQLELQDGLLRMTIADDGAGFEQSQAERGRGLHNMRERLSELGGRLDICSQPKEGTKVIAELPVPGEGAEL